MRHSWDLSLRLLLAASWAVLTLTLPVDSARAQTPEEGLLQPLVEAVDRSDSDWVRRALADPSFRTALDATGQTSPVLHGLGQAETLDGDLRRQAYREAIDQGRRELGEAIERPTLSARSATQYDLLSDYVLFLQQDYLLHRFASLPTPDRENSNHIAALEAVLVEVQDVYRGLIALLPACGEEPACRARGEALLEQRRTFGEGPLADAVRLARDANSAELRAYSLYEEESRYGPEVRSYEAASGAFELAADLSLIHI